MLRAIGHIAEKLGLKTIVEGVEHEAQRAALRQLGFRHSPGPRSPAGRGAEPLEPSEGLLAEARAGPSGRSARHGACFRVGISPRQSKHKASSPDDRDEPQPPAHRLTSRDGANVAEMRALLADILSEEGYDVMVAASGARALSIMNDDPPDLLITDLLMPGMSGFSLARSCFGGRFRRRPRAVCVLASAERDARRRGRPGEAAEHRPAARDRAQADGRNRGRGWPAVPD